MMLVGGEVWINSITLEKADRLPFAIDPLCELSGELGPESERGLLIAAIASLGTTVWGRLLNFTSLGERESLKNLGVKKRRKKAKKNEKYRLSYIRGVTKINAIWILRGVAV